MSNEIQASKDFQTKMFEKIRDQMGDLLTEEELKALVEKAMEKAFFEERTTSDGYGRKTTNPPLFLKLIEEEVRDQVKEATRAYLEENTHVIQEAISEAIHKGFSGIVLSYIDNKIGGHLFSFGQQIEEAFQRKGN